MTLLDVKSLRLGYGRNDVIAGIDIAVPQGAIVALIGANGAGKTTILRGISGLLKPRAGSIRV
jgi:branched-chain amino acid transport system ATP-binding protein